MHVHYLRCFVEGIWSAVAFFFSLVLSIYITKYLHQGQKLDKWILLFSLTAVYGNTLTALSMSIALFYSSLTLSQNMDINNPIYKALHVTSIITYSIAQTAMYLFFTYRCQSTFANTAYASSNCTYRTLYVLISLYIFTQLGFVVIAKLIDYDYFIVGTVASAITFCVDLIGSISMLTLFVNKTLQIIVSDLTVYTPESQPVLTGQASTVSATGSDLDRRNSYICTQHLNERQKALLYVNIKITLLSLCIMVSYQIYIFICWSYNVLGIHDRAWLMSKSVEDRYFYLNLSWWMFDCAISTLCVYLNFKITDRVYWRICSKCHLLVNKCCEGMVRRKAREHSRVPSALEVQSITSFKS